MLSVLLTALLAQAPVSLPQLTERHCSSSGWCVVLPAPLYPGRVAARGDVVVSHGIHSGVVSLWRAGAWRDTLDTGLGPLRRLVLADAPGGAPRLFACDRARCVRAKVEADRLGPLALVPEGEVPPEPPEPPKTAVRAPRPGVRFLLENGHLLVETAGQRRPPPALKGTQFARNLDVVFGGGPGEPLWLYRASETGRLTVTPEHPLGTLDRFRLDRYCTLGVSLLGEPHQPTALCDDLYTHSILRFDGERWQALTTDLGWASKDFASLKSGEGCAPCVVSHWRMLWRARDGSWRGVELPESPPDAQSVHHPEHPSIDARGRPGFVSQYGTYRHEGRTWRRVGEAPAKKEVTDPPRRPLCNATGCLHERELKWSPDGEQWRPLELPPAEPGSPLALAREETQSAKTALCTNSRAALANGEFALIINSLLVRGTPGKGWRTERLPIGNACALSEAPEALYLADPLRKTLVVQRREAAPVAVPEGTWATVSGVKARDVLRVREVPDWRALEVATLTPGTRCVREVSRRTVSARESWAEVLTPEGQRGWVNRRYLTPTQGPCPAAGRQHR